MVLAWGSILTPVFANVVPGLSPLPIATSWKMNEMENQDRNLLRGCRCLCALFLMCGICMFMQLPIKVRSSTL